MPSACQACVQVCQVANKQCKHFDTSALQTEISISRISALRLTMAAFAALFPMGHASWIGDSRHLITSRLRSRSGRPGARQTTFLPPPTTAPSGCFSPLPMLSSLSQRAPAAGSSCSLPQSCTAFRTQRVGRRSYKQKCCATQGRKDGPVTSPMQAVLSSCDAFLQVRCPGVWCWRTLASSSLACTASGLVSGDTAACVREYSRMA